MTFFHLELSVKSEIYVSKFQPRSMSYLLCTLPPQHTYIHKNTITRSYFHLLNFYSKKSVCCTLCGCKRESISFSFLRLSSSRRRILAFIVDASWFIEASCCKQS